MPLPCVPAKRQKRGIKIYTDRGSCWDVRRARGPVWRALGAAPDAARGAQVGGYLSSWARETESQLGRPAPGTSWLVSWETWGEQRKAPSPHWGCGHHCCKRPGAGQNQSPPLCVDSAGSLPPSWRGIRNSPPPTTLGHPHRGTSPMDAPIPRRSPAPSNPLSGSGTEALGRRSPRRREEGAALTTHRGRRWRPSRSGTQCSANTAHSLHAGAWGAGLRPLKPAALRQGRG